MSRGGAGAAPGAEGVPGAGALPGAGAVPGAEGAPARAQAEALEAGRAVVDLTRWRKVLVSGRDAAGWLNDLLTADLSGLRPGRARRSLLLSPTGRIRADVLVARLPRGFLLVQAPDQPSGIDGLLMPYLLSSDVRLDDETDGLALLALPSASGGPAGGGGRPPGGPVTEGWHQYSPSCLGAGFDLVGPAGRLGEALEAALAAPPHRRRPDQGRVLVGEAAAEAWRVRHGRPRFPIDLTPDSLPHEADLGDAVAFGKGCYLGQEAVARVRNLGRPPFLVVALRAEGPAAEGERVLAGEEEAGLITSAADLEDGHTAVIARVRWQARERPLRTAPGVTLHPGSASAAP